MRICNKLHSEGELKLLHTGQPLEEAARKRYFWSKANRAKHRFEPGQVWTFTMYQHFVDMASYELDMLKRFDLACHLDGMPLQFMVKVGPDLNMMMWPERYCAMR